MSKTQKISLAFERNGSNWGMTKDCVKHNFDIELPDGFDTGVHLVGAKTSDKINNSATASNGMSAESTPTGWVTMVTEVITDRDIEKIVGKVLTVVDATFADQEQKKAFKSLIKQAIYGHYNNIRERSYQNVDEPPVLFGEFVEPN